MESIDQAALQQKLIVENPKARLGDIVQYLQAFEKYQKAQANIDEYGLIVIHPRTGVPIENPYLKIQIQAQAILRKFIHLKTDVLWS